MVGFPYETEAEFTETLDFAKKARFLDAHVFCYSKREGTEAYGFDCQVDGAVKEERSKRLSKLIREIRDEILDSAVLEARPTSAIVETLTNGLYTAHTPSYIEISIDDNGTCDLRGKNVKVRPVSHKNGILHCEIVN